MKWFLLFLIFIAGIYYLVNQRKEEMRQKVAAEQVQKDKIIATAEPDLPQKPDKVYVMKLSMQTLSTLRTLTYDANDKVRAAAVDLLWQLQDDQAPVIIKRIFQEETEDSVKKNLIDILARDKSKLSLALLSEAMNSYDKETRLRAVDAIGSFSNKEAIQVLNKGLKDYDEDVRLKSLEAVNRIRRDIEANKEHALNDLQGQQQPAIKIE